MFERYVAIGDSTTEGLDDPDGRGGYRGWANRFAEHLASTQGHVEYANLGVRGLRTRRIRETQLAPALAMRPDVVTVVGGTNDLMGFRFDPDAFARDMEEMQCAFIAIGARVLTFTLPDLSVLIPWGRRLGRRIARLNDALRGTCERTGATLVDLARFEAAVDPRFWSDDRLHANAVGHERIAAALAHAAGLAGFDGSWRKALDPAPPRRALDFVRAEIAWTRRHLAPWIWRHARGRSSGDGRAAKRPRLEPMRFVTAVSRSESHTMAKEKRAGIRLLAGLGVDGDAHAGATVKHRSRIAKDPTKPNLRQVHLIHAELHDELRNKGFALEPGRMGENVTTRGVDLLALPAGARLHVGGAIIEITGLRNPCAQLDGIQQGLREAVFVRDAQGGLVRRAGVMAIVVKGGDVRAGDHIRIELPPEPHRALEPV